MIEIIDTCIITGGITMRTELRYCREGDYITILMRMSKQCIKIYYRIECPLYS